jgi:quinoprotein glucose dehydrogenase
MKINAEPILAKAGTNFGVVLVLLVLLPFLPAEAFQVFSTFSASSLRALRSKALKPLTAELAETSSRTQRQASAEPASANRDWPIYLGENGAHYSPLAQINKDNVKQLQIAWTYDTEETGGLQTSPIVIRGILYGISPSQKVFALDAATGKLKWKFDSGIVGTQPNRGLAYWESGNSTDHRIIVGVMNFVYEINADDGNAIASFGDHGRIDLREDLGRDPAAVSIALTSPAVVYKDLFIVGGREPETLPCPPGDIRAYDVRTGKLRWSFHTIPHPGEFGYDTWPKDAWKAIGSANNWTGMTLDSKAGIVYVPTGSAAFDFYGDNRVGDDLFADSEVALNAESGKRLWHFQGVRHDLWDRDFPAPPALVEIQHDGKTVEAVAQTTKQGFVYVFDRANGTPLFPIEYRRYPESDLPGEAAADEQPLPTKPAPYARQLLTEDLLTNRTPEAHQWALEQFRTFRSEGQFVPLSTKQNTVIFPGFDGGAEWGGPAFDPETGLLYVNSNDIAWDSELAENTAPALSGRGIYQGQCTICHQDNMAGAPPNFPSLIGVGKRMDRTAIATVIQKGQGRMPAYPDLTQDEVNVLIDYLTKGESKQLSAAQPAPPLMRYRFSGYTRFSDPDGYPAVTPPWGTLNAINLNTGEYAWKIPFGEYPELVAKGMKDTGTENYGGPIVTAGGLLFIGATNYDKKFRAFDKSTGALLWETTLPFAGNATPVAYEVNGRQYVVIAAGGGKDLKSKSGGVYVAFALGD